MSTRLTRLFAVIGVQPLSEAALGAIISPPVFWRRYFCSLSHWELFRSDPQLALVWTMWRWNVECSRCREEGLWSCDQVCCCFLVTRHTPHVTRHTSHATRHTSHAPRHTPHVTRLQTVRERVPRPSPHPQQKPIRLQLSRRFQSCHWHLCNRFFTTSRRMQRVAIDDA